MHNLENEIRSVFLEKLENFEKENKIIFDTSAKDKLIYNYLNTILIEKDIEIEDWLTENKEDILYVYKEELHEQIDD